jgi:hypothetical protein
MTNKIERRAVIYKCSCNGNKAALRQRHYLTETIVDEDEYCIYCGNVAVAKTAFSSSNSDASKMYAREINIEENGKTGSGKILSGWKEVSRF